MRHTIEIDEADQHAVVIALAKLAVDRPGWTSYLRGIAAGTFGDVGLFDNIRTGRFDGAHRITAEPGPKGSSS